MKPRLSSWVAAGLVVTLAVLSAGALPAGAQTIPSDPRPTCFVTPSIFASWFESGSPSLNGVVKPADSIAFPHDSDCSFHKWSMQMFLWLTSPAPPPYGGGGGRIFASPAFFDVSPLDAKGERSFIKHMPGKPLVLSVRDAQVGPHGLPVIFDRTGRMLEVETPKLSARGKQLILDRSGKSVEIESARIVNGKPVFLDKAGKAIASPKPLLRSESGALIVQKLMIGKVPIFLDRSGAVIDTGVGQADGGVLLAQNGSLVYYTTTVNDVYAYFLTGTKNGGITPKPTQFPTTQADLNKITAFAAAHGKTFPDPNALAIEIKSSWVEAAGLPDPGNYITMKATVPTYDRSSPTLWTPNGQKTVELALVGMHVVGSTAGHPEMIWATFEHFDVTPNAAYDYNSTSGRKTVPQSAGGTWLFSKSGSASPVNVMKMHVPSGQLYIERLSSYTISPSDTLRMKVWGSAADAAAANAEMLSINNSILSLVPFRDVRKKYFMVGSTWTNGGVAPTPDNQVGTNKLANTTMETYQQGINSSAATGTNCFSCHRLKTPEATLTTLSHVFAPLKSLF